MISFAQKTTEGLIGIAATGFGGRAKWLVAALSLHLRTE